MVARDHGSAYYSPEKGTMFDREVVEGLKERHESRVRDLQVNVSMQFDGLKRFAQDIWRAQKFEDLVFGRVVFPISLINGYLKTAKLPHAIKNLNLVAMPSGKLELSLEHIRFGPIIIDIEVVDIIINSEQCVLRYHVMGWEMPKANWFIRNLVKMGLFTAGIDLGFINKTVPLVHISRSQDDNFMEIDDTYDIDITKAIQHGLHDFKVSLDMIHLIDWGVNERFLGLQLSISAEKLVAYLKQRMPNLFD